MCGHRRPILSLSSSPGCREVADASSPPGHRAQQTLRGPFPQATSHRAGAGPFRWYSGPLMSHYYLAPLGINANSLTSSPSNAQTRRSLASAPSAPPHSLENSCDGISSESLSRFTLTLALGLAYFLPHLDHQGKEAAQVCACLVRGCLVQVCVWGVMTGESMH